MRAFSWKTRALPAMACTLLLSCLLACGKQEAPPPPEPPPAATELKYNPYEMESVADREASRNPEDRRPVLGSWNMAPVTDAGITDAQREAMAELESIGYAGGSVSGPSDTGVTVNDAMRAYRGLNLYSSGHHNVGLLTDMDGKVLHEWRYDYAKLWPDSDLPKNPAWGLMWRRLALSPNGDLTAIHEGLGILRLDKDSRLLWALPNRAHHDLRILADGNILTLTRKARIEPLFSAELPILEDFAATVSPDGVELSRVSMLECIRNSEFTFLLDEALEWFNVTARDQHLRERGDFLHTNSIERIDNRLSKRVPAVKEGDVLVAFRNIGRVAAVDLEARRVVWVLPEKFYPHHHPTVLENGNILLMQNAWQPMKTAVFEINPESGEKVWSFTADDAPDGFYTEFCGNCYRLPNGNTLIVESKAGRAFEVTPDKTVVWSFSNPNRAGEHQEFIATIFDLVRLETSYVSKWLGDARQDAR